MLGRADAEGEAALGRVVDAYAKSIGGYRAQVGFSMLTLRALTTFRLSTFRLPDPSVVSLC